MSDRAAQRPAASPFGWMREVTRRQWVVLLAGWLGWVFDTMDQTLHPFVQEPAMRELLGPAATTAQIAQRNGLVMAVTLAGFAAGGVVFGLVADRLGRTKALSATILLYSLFTGLSGLAGSWQQLALFRFLSGLGLGGEWAAGAALVAEVWPERLRAKAGALLQSAGSVGFVLAGLVARLIGADSWRHVYFVGLAPALVLLFLRLFVRESESFVQVQAARAAQRGSGGELSRSPLRVLFLPAHRRDTILATLLAFVVLVVLWGGAMWIPSAVRELAAPGLASLSAADRASRLYAYTFRSGLLLNVGSLVGFLAFAPLADRLGRRGAFAVYLVGGLIAFPVAFLGTPSLAHIFALLPVVGFFAIGIGSGFPIYLPELFPAYVRATGTGFCFNAGRLFTAVGVFGAGQLVGRVGSTARALAVVSLVYLVGLALLPFARETGRRASRAP